MPQGIANEARKERVKQAIVTAFADVPYPGDDAITLPPRDYRTKKIDRELKGVQWQDVPLDLLQHVWLHLLSPAGRRFYLPAYLLLTLDQLQDTSWIYMWVLYTLDPPEQMGWFEREYGVYTPAQKQAIRLFLECVRDEAADPSARETARDALERYWAREPNAPLPHSAEPARKAEVKRAIREAFADVPYPGDKGIGDDLDDWETAAVNRDFKGCHWREVPRDTLAYHHDDLPFFSLRGKQFYLPAYLLASMDQFHQILDPVIYRLCSDVKDRAYIEGHYGFYTPAQKHAVRLFLEYVRDEMPDEEHLRLYCLFGLDEYWAPKERPALDRARKERLDRAILEAFADMPYPGDDGIVWSRFPDSSDEEMAQHFRGHSFRDIPRKVLIEHNHLTGFSEKGLQYYLPAYLLAALDEVADIVYWTVDRLRPRKTEEEYLAWFKSRFDPYTPAQKQAIRLFLEYVRDAMPHLSLVDLAEQALDRCWGRASVA
jgi:hypothetical protein